MKKQQLREYYKNLRGQLSNKEQADISKCIAENLVANFDLVGKNVSCFVPISRFQELNTWLIMDSVAAAFYLPVIGVDGQLKHIRYEGKDKLRKNAFGILEPVSGQEISPSDLDVILVPLLTIDKDGFRVGYGKGYYDQFLAKCKPGCMFIGLYQFENLEVIEDLHSADIALHHCVTPTRLISFKQQD